MKVVYKRSLFWLSLAIIVLMLGVGIRLINVTNPPLDFHAWRQLRSASIARSLYYTYLPSANPDLRDKAQALGRFEAEEPPIFEHIVAFSYLLFGEEKLWIARVFSIIFWSLGGAAVYLLARDMTSSAGGLLSLAFYLFLPYGVSASRSFQPDPFMVMWILWGIWALRKWRINQTWKWAILAAVFSGIAVLVKVFAVFPIALTAIITVLEMGRFNQVIKRPQVWVVAAVMVIIPATYYIFTVGHLASGYISGWSLGFVRLLFQPSFYIRWITFLRGMVDLTVIAIALCSIFLLKRDDRLMMIGLFGGYLLIGLVVPSLIITHDYYSLYLIPVIAISLAPLADLIFSKVSEYGKFWQGAMVLVVFASFLYMGLIARNNLVSKNYRPEILGWIKIGQELPKDASYIGITHDYNTRLKYYGWVNVAAWPLTLDQTQMHALAGGNADMNSPEWEKIFNDKTKGFDYFIVTLFDELNTQPMLKRMLDQYASYEGEGYTIYNLHQKK
jgi:4-amino-4-deoxy-L-arabinose transferase-like glycosyltransferase